MKRERFYIKPFNTTFNVFLFGTIGIAIVAGIIMKDTDMQLKKNILYGFSVFNFLFYNWYKFMMSKDTEYSELCIKAGEGRFNWFNELPFHLCNVNITLIPLGVFLDKSYIIACCMITAILGTGMAIVMPSPGLEKGSLLKPRILGFFGFHIFLVGTGIYLLSTGIYVPSYADIIPMLIFLAGMAFVAFLINIVLIKTKLNPIANYFYTVRPGSNLILKKFFKMIPIPYVYVLPFMPVGGILLAIITFVYNLL